MIAMGMYTELNMSVEIVADASTIALLEYMVNDGADPGNVPDHPLFKRQGWQYCFNACSFYFPHTEGSSLVNKSPWDEPENPNAIERILNIRCDLKDYHDEIKLLLDWLYPYIKTRGFVGYTRYEEDEHPTLIYITDSGVEYKNV